jgi:3-hydroxyisobutyrate dehydrogenase-like beta-hydroxyacid dehydrogenase
MPLVFHNRTTAVAHEVAAATGGEVAGSPREAAEWAEIVVTSLADDQAVIGVFRGEDGVIAGVTPGTVILETSTIDPQTSRALAPEVSAAGGSLLDAPVSGSVTLVESGSLTFMVGGPAAEMHRAEPVLSALGANVFHLGDVGAGHTVKLAVNALVHAINTAVSESLVLAELAGVDRAAAYEVFMSGAGGSPFVKYKQAAFVDPDHAPVAFSIDLVAKDLRLILGLAERVGAPMSQGLTNLEITEAAIAAGLGAADMSAIAVNLRP